MDGVCRNIGVGGASLGILAGGGVDLQADRVIQRIEVGIVHQETVDQKHQPQGIRNLEKNI